MYLSGESEREDASDRVPHAAIEGKSDSREGGWGET